ncbi:MAG: hypothetical protein WBG65_09170 [Sulfurimonadaceae bacterium]
MKRLLIYATTLLFIGCGSGSDYTEAVPSVTGTEEIAGETIL